MEDFAEEQAQTIWRWLSQGLHGAMISGALWRINTAYSSLSQVIPDSQIGRITGPQQVEQRRVDQFKDLILATPTVDIGYNFIKHHKDRQNLDFVVFDARYRDEFTQRLGRAGRVLGKSVTDQSSFAVAVVSEPVERELAVYDQQTMTRTELADALGKLGSLPEKNEFSSYLKAGGLYENAYPLFKARTMFSIQEEQLLEALYLRVRDVFASDSRISFGQIKCQFRLESVISTWLREPNDSYALQRIPDVFQEFTEWLMGERYHLSASQVQQYLSDSRISSGFRTYCEMRQALLQAQFSFRDSFSGPTAWVYDPYHLLSDTDVTQYDLIHILENYEVDFIDLREWKSVTNEPAPTAAIRVHLRRQRVQDQRMHIRLRWVPPDMGMPGGWEEERFLRCFVAGDPVALKGAMLVCDQPLARVFQQSLADRYVTALLVSEALEGAMRRALMDRQIYPRKLQVTLPSGRELRFQAILGTNAFLIAPMLHYAFANSEKMQTEAIIC
jgi:CRISPR-associated endonuclease/helicase Cas3